MVFAFTILAAAMTTAQKPMLKIGNTTLLPFDNKKPRTFVRDFLRFGN